MFAVTPINFLNNAFPPITAREIEIDVGPAFAVLIQETLEDEMVAHRINRGIPRQKQTALFAALPRPCTMMLFSRQKLTMSQTIKK